MNKKSGSDYAATVLPVIVEKKKKRFGKVNKRFGLDADNVSAKVLPRPEHMRLAEMFAHRD